MTDRKPAGSPDRADYIGSSDAAAILGYSPWRTALDVYWEKTGEVPPEPFSREQLARMEYGKKREAELVDLVAAMKGLTVGKRNQRYRHKTHPFIAAEIDAETDTGEHIEVKTSSGRNRHLYGDDIPDHYLAQVQHALAVTGEKVCHFLVCFDTGIGEDDIRYYRIEAEPKIIDLLIKAEVAFWQRVQDRIPPDYTSLEQVRRQYTTDSGTGVAASHEITAAHTRLLDATLELKDLQKEIDDLKTRIAAYMGSHTWLGDRDKPLATFKTTETTRLDTKLLKETDPDTWKLYAKKTQSRTLLIKEV